MRIRKWTDDELAEAVVSSSSIANVLRILNLRPAGGNYAYIKKKISELDISIDHFTGDPWNKGLTGTFKPKEPLSALLIENRLVASSKLKGRLLREGYFERKCYNCGLISWLGKPIPLELEHINGIHTDNRIDNLTILCPNCHAQTPTYRGKNQAAIAQRQRQSS